MSWRKNLLSVVLGINLIAPLAATSADSARASGAAASSSRVLLSELVREALERNPEIQAARHVIEAKRARVPQARAWPDPTLSVSYGGNLLPPYTLMGGDPSSARQFTAEQEIPYPGKTRLRGEVAAREVDAEELVVEELRRRIAAEVKQDYFDLYFTDRGLATLRESHEILAKIEKVTEIRYSVGKVPQQDVLKAQVELSKISERQTLLEQTRRTLEAQLNSLRNLPVDTPLGAVGEVRPSAPSFSLEQMVAAAERDFPSLKRQRVMIEGNRLAVELARKEVRPNFSLGYTYMQRTGLPDMYGLTFSTSLPIFRRHKQDQAIVEASANLESSRRSEASELNLLRYRLKQEYLQAKAAEELLKLYTQALVPQSRLTLESSLATYQTGATDFLTVLSNFAMVLDSELNYHRHVAEHEKALARLEELTGLDLIQSSEVSDEHK